MSNNIVLFEGPVDMESTKLYVVKGRQYEKEVFVAIDRHSGGYPWYVDTVFHAEKVTSVEKALSLANDSFVKKDLNRIRILEIMLREVGDAEIDPNYAKAQDIIKNASPEVLQALKESLK